MKTIVCTLALLLIPAIARASISTLVATVDANGGGGGNNQYNQGNLAAVSLGISYQTADDQLTHGPAFWEADTPYTDWYMGDTLLGFNKAWEEGESGEVVYDSGNSGDAFDNFVGYLTNGIDDYYLGTWQLGVTPEGNYTTPSSGGGSLESVRLGQSHDLVGYRIDYIKLVVSGVEIYNERDSIHQERWVQTTSYDARWEIYGADLDGGVTIPETTSLAIWGLGLGTIAIVRRREATQRIDGRTMN